MTARETMRDMFVASGVEKSRKAMQKYYRAVRRPEIMQTGMPVSQSARYGLWAARQALIALGDHTRMWEIGRELDVAMIQERDK